MHHHIRQLTSRRMVVFYISIVVMCFKPEISQYVMAIAISIVGVSGIDAVKSNPQNLPRVE